MVDLGLANQPIKLNKKKNCRPETKISELIESNKKFSALPTTESGYRAAPFIQYEQISLKNLYKQY